MLELTVLFIVKMDYLSSSSNWSSSNDKKPDNINKLIIKNNIAKK